VRIIVFFFLCSRLLCVHATVLFVFELLSLADSMQPGSCVLVIVELITSIGGVSALVQQEKSRAIYTYCYRHALSLACGEAVKT